MRSFSWISVFGTRTGVELSLHLSGGIGSLKAVEDVQIALVLSVDASVVGRRRDGESRDIGSSFCRTGFREVRCATANVLVVRHVGMMRSTANDSCHRRSFITSSHYVMILRHSVRAESQLEATGNPGRQLR